MQATQFLDDIRVVDLSQYIPGPFATRQLADLGADVIKIEPPAGDPMRYFMHRDDDEISPIYRHVNRGKRIARLDLKTRDGTARLEDLLGEADILLESFRPGALARLGFDRECLSRLNPRLIHCALSGYGQTGPYRLRAGHDVNYCALATVLTLNGSRERPAIGYPPIADHAGALQASVAMLAALHARGRDGRGAYLDISLFESVLAWQYLPLADDDERRAESILNGGAACYNVYRCADGEFVSLGALESTFWENFCRSVGQPQWGDRQFEAMPQRGLIDELAALFATQPVAHWRALLDQVDCCFEALQWPRDLAGHAQVDARESLRNGMPVYSGWIGDAPLEVAPDLTEIGDSVKLVWRNAMT